MKKILSVMVLALLLSLMILPVLAEGKTSLTVTPSVGEVNQGATEEITFTVSVSGDKGIRSVAFALDFDTNAFEFVSWELDASFGQLVFMKDFDKQNLKFVSSMGLEAKSYSGNVMTFTLKLKSDAKSDGYKVSIKSETVVGDGGDLETTVTPAALQVKCIHTYKWEAVDGTDTHTETCTKCGETKTVAHSWNDEGEVVKKATCTEAGTIKYACEYCNAEKEEAIQATGHQDMSAWKSDGSKHWHECSACGHKDGEEAHTPGAEATDTTAQTCTACGHVLKEALGHDYSTTWRHDGTNHWHECNNAGCDSKGSYGRHVYDDACDITCNTCGYVRRAPHKYGEEWLSNEQGHFHICVLCNIQSEIVAHEPGEPATEDAPQTCTVCGYILAMQLSHEHKFDDKWECDEAGHWQICTDLTCNECSEKQEHTWSDVVTNADGKKVKTCTVCGYETVADEETTPTEPETPPTEPEETKPVSGTTGEPTNTTQSGFPWWVIAVAAVVLLCVGIVLLVLEIMRSKKMNSHGKFSK